MTVFITGVNFEDKRGFIGSHLVDYLSSINYPYVTLEGDILKTNSVTKQMRNCDTVIHLAGLHKIDVGENDPNLFFQTNVNGTWSILQAALKNKVKKFIFPSSLAVVYNRRTTYAMTKMIVEEMLQTYGDRMTFIMFRLASVYDEEHGTIGWLLNAHEPINLYGDGKQVRDFVHVDDVSEVFARALMWDKRQSFRCDVGTGRGSTMISLAELARVKYNLVPDPNPQFNPPFNVANSVTSQETLGWVPQVDFRDFIVMHRKRRVMV